MLAASKIVRRIAAAVAFVAATISSARAMEIVTLKSGFPISCIRHEAVGERTRLFLEPSTPGAEIGYTDVRTSSIVTIEVVADPPPPPPTARPSIPTQAAAAAPTAAELRQLLSQAGSTHNIDAELLASVVHAESGGNLRAVSRTGAQGLMQLMPGTAAAVGVKDAFVAAQNVEGGTAYLDQMLTRYHDNLAKALAAYNAGPGAVDKYHGVPPFHETRAYVARVIREFNRRKLEALRSSSTMLAKVQ
jgi:soluble lytic murein transglycosylase-like protein